MKCPKKVTLTVSSQNCRASKSSPPNLNCAPRINYLKHIGESAVQKYLRTTQRRKTKRKQNRNQVPIQALPQSSLQMTQFLQSNPQKKATKSLNGPKSSKAD